MYFKIFFTLSLMSGALSENHFEKRQLPIDGQPIAGLPIGRRYTLGVQRRQLPGLPALPLDSLPTSSILGRQAPPITPPAPPTGFTPPGPPTGVPPSGFPVAFFPTEFPPNFQPGFPASFPKPPVSIPAAPAVPAAPVRRLPDLTSSFDSGSDSDWVERFVPETEDEFEIPMEEEEENSLRDLLESVEENLRKRGY